MIPLIFFGVFQVAQYYQFVLSVLESAAGAVVVKKHKDWAKNLQIKSTLYTAIAHVRIKELYGLKLNKSGI